MRAVCGARSGQDARERREWQEAMVVADRIHMIDEPGAGNVRPVVDAAVAGKDDANLRVGQVRLKPRG